jgi:hypothetical protein
MAADSRSRQPLLEIFDDFKMADEHERPFRGSRHTYSSLQKVKNILQFFKYFIVYGTVGNCTVKKDVDFPVPIRDVTDQTPSWTGIIKLLQPRESLISDIPAGDGKFDKLFYSVYIALFDGLASSIVIHVPSPPV